MQETSIYIPSEDSFLLSKVLEEKLLLLLKKYYRDPKYADYQQPKKYRNIRKAEQRKKRFGDIDLNERNNDFVNKYRQKPTNNKVQALT